MPGPLPAHCDDPIAEEELQSRGWKIDVVPWQEKNRNWSQYDIVVVRSTWDYFDYQEAFLENLEEISRQTLLLNPSDLIRWNVEKTYLKEMSEKGLSTVPTMWMESFNWEQIQSSFQSLRTERIVIKPTISAGSKNTYLIGQSDLESYQEVLSKDFSERPAMIQPFLPSIQTVGEHSLFFFGGQYSHTVVKVPKSGDFRVQEEFGGETTKVDPSQKMNDLATEIVKKIPYKTLYARVDLVQWQEKWALIELELIEPSLYFRCDDQSASRFADALEKVVSESKV